DQTLQHLERAVVLEVQREAALVAVHAHEGRALVAPERRRPGAGIVAASRPLDLDDVGTHVAEDLRAEWSGDVLGEIDDDDSLERQRHGEESTTALVGPRTAARATTAVGMRTGRGHGARALLLPRLTRLVDVVPLPLLIARRRQIGGLLGRVPGLRRRVATAMSAALGRDGFRPEHVTAYFHHLADLIVLSAAAFHWGVGAAGLARYSGNPGAAARPYHDALARGRGALMVSPHLIGHELAVGECTEDLPVTVLVRRSSRPEYEAVKMRWYAA